MKIQPRDIGLLVVGFVVGFAIASFLAKNRTQQVQSLPVSSNPVQQAHLTVDAAADGATIVSGELKQRAVRKILEIDVAKSGGCTQTRRIIPKPVSFMRPGVLTERWGVERCGATAFYNVQFIPNPEGEIEVAVSRDDGFQ